MDWIRQNNFLATFGGITLLGVLGLGYFAFSSWKASSAALTEFGDTRDKLERLENAQLHPNEDNLEEVKTKVDAYAASVEALRKKLEAAQKPLPTDVDVTKFGEKIQAELAPFQAKAKELGVLMGDNFYMGMDKYRTETASNTEVLQKLEWSLGGISHLADLVLESGIKSLNNFQRTVEPWELPKAAPVVEQERPRSRRRRTSSSKDKAAPAPPKMADVSEETRIRMRISGSPDSITEFINKVSNDTEYFYWIRWAKIGNETSVGPSRTKIFNPVQVNGDEPDLPDEDGTDEEPRPPEEEQRPAMIDVFPILGSEQVRADLLIDIVRFRDPEAAGGQETSENSN